MLSRSTSEASFILIGPDAAESLSGSLKNAREDKPKVHSSAEATYRPGSSPSHAHDWSAAGTGGLLTAHGRHFIDAYGRVCNLRGVNLSGCSKTPVNDDHDLFPVHSSSVTFVGRPFPLEEAHEHLSRLRRWGLTFIRFIVTWEAVEHTGPGIYDTDYLEYLRKVLSLLPNYGMTAFIAMHQDVWSRYSGGSGAPSWTLEVVGFDLMSLEETGAAWLVGVKGGGHVEVERGIWPCGYQKLAASTMATCFWAGDTFAPKLKIKSNDGSEVTVQQFLQNAFLNMWEVVARTVGDLPGVLGFEIMNEPHRGYVQLPSLHEFDYNSDLHLSYVPTAFQSFLLGAGHPTSVGHWTRSFPMPTRLTSEGVLNPDGKKAWREDGPTESKCLWEMHGVWGWDRSKKEGVVLRENYFTKHPMTNQKIDWYTDFYYPFVQKWSDRVRKFTGNEKLVFVEPIPNEFCPSSWTSERQPTSLVYAPHWYDLNALFAKAFGNFTVNVQGLSRGMFPLKAFYWGHKGARDNFFVQIKNIVEAGYKSLGEKPVVIGECGIPMDLNKGEAFRSEDWTSQLKMMDAMMSALERCMIGFTLWNYNPSNTDQLGDDWNGENFSWFSRSRALPASLLSYEQTSPTLDNGGRILPSIVRPYPAKTAGIPLKFEYEMNTGAFTFEWSNPNASAPSTGTPSIFSPPLGGHPILAARETEIYVPSALAQGRKLVVEDLDSNDRYVYDESRQTLFIVTGDTDPGAKHRVSVTLRPPLTPAFEVNDFMSDFGAQVMAVGVVVFAFFAYIFATYLR
ncbi:glycoside hydrolase family 5 protein [Neolentinus lepideus HHB14362 ss-1]|uniref:Glycoside hydrolase family 5 protein n=1 Tax=Neolentinus lepideus HHB14362 ss-1 TaxID=1314782 RepID=A0A165T285_9AGAM|nr:glycoside hydrolase family 5 protein [Neolentinus lepideus HHB14362 ss-1]